MQKIIKSLILISIFGLAITPAQAISPRVYKLGALGTFEKLNLTSCVQNNCIEIKADKATQGLITGGISAKNGAITIQNIESKKSIAKFSGAIYYDANQGKIYFTDITNSKFKEAYFDQQTGEFIKM